MVLLQIVSALLLLLNKIYVYKKKAIGWLYGIAGCTFITVYFYLQMTYQGQTDLWIMVIYDCALTVLMIYGYLLASNGHLRLKAVLKKWNLEFKILISVFTVVVCTYLLVRSIKEELVAVQFISVVLGLAGTLLLAFNTKYSNITGWALYFLAHLIVVYLMIKTNSPFIAVCQVVSAYVAVLGIKNEIKNNSSKPIPIS